MISRKLNKDPNLQTIIGFKLNKTNETKTADTLRLSTSRKSAISAYADIGAIDPEVSRIENRQWLTKTINAKKMDDDFFSTRVDFKRQKFDDKLFNADKPLPSREKIIEPEKPKIEPRLNVMSEFNNI